MSGLRVFFFFQAEDGIRDLIVTGVQTCALPISLESADEEKQRPSAGPDLRARLGSIDRPEGGDVDTRRDDLDARRVGSVSPHELLALINRGGDEQVGAACDVALHRDSQRRLGARSACEMLVLDETKR